MLGRTGLLSTEWSVNILPVNCRLFTPVSLNSLKELATDLWLEGLCLVIHNIQVQMALSRNDGHQSSELEVRDVYLNSSDRQYILIQIEPQPGRPVTD